MESAAPIGERLAALRHRIEAAGGVGIDILAVTKGFGPDAVVACAQIGLARVGENYAQEAVDKIEVVRAGGVTASIGPRWSRRSPNGPRVRG